MIALARAVYAVPGGKPAELLDTARFPCGDVIERHLFDGFLRVTYQDQSARDRAAEWLRFLAGLGDQDLAWWRLENSVSRPVRGVAVGCIIGLLLGLAVTPFLGRTGGLVCTLIAGIAAGFAFALGQTRRPSRIEVRFRGNGPSLLCRALASLGIGLGVTPIVGLAVGSFGALISMTALTAHLWLDAPPDVTTASSPRSLLARDRVAALTLSGIVVLAFDLIPNCPTRHRAGRSSACQSRSR